MITHVQKGCLVIEHPAGTEVWKYRTVQPFGSTVRTVVYYGVWRGDVLIAAYRAEGGGGLQIEVSELIAAHAAWGCPTHPPYDVAKRFD